jgi:hypothetical protein
MDKKEDFAERRARQKEKLRGQRAEKRLASSTKARCTSTTPSSTPLQAKADRAADSEGHDFVHVEKEDAAQADSGVALAKAPLVAKVNLRPISYPAQHKAKSPTGSPFASKPISKAEDGLGKLHLVTSQAGQQEALDSESTPIESIQASAAQAGAAGQVLAAASQGMQQSTAGESLSADQLAKQPGGGQIPIEAVRKPTSGLAGEALQARPATPSKAPVPQQQSAAGKSTPALPGATTSNNSVGTASQLVRWDHQPSTQP